MLIGWQIATVDLSEFPDEFISSEVLSQATVREFFADKQGVPGWVVHPVYEGDIEDPSFV
jgi:hypothetical protein